jgi:hypothetical protein
MKTTNLSNVIFVIFLLINIAALEFTLNVSMKNSNNINASFVKRALALRMHLNCTLTRCMPTKSCSNVNCVNIQLSNRQPSKNILNVYMKILSNINVAFVKRAMVIKILKGFMKIKSPSIVICVIIQLSNMQRLKDTLNVSMENSNSTNATFDKRVLD